MRYYDPEKKHLIYIEEQATPEFWDRQWEDERLQKSIMAGEKDRFVYPYTRHYLKPGAKILEGGCGKGQFVYSLHRRNYDAHGIDFAKNTIQKVQKLFPDLNLYEGDIRELPFADETFHGYWSLGVIEHFPEGYDLIQKEMYRVLKPGGYLFLTFPSMSLLRRLKARIGLYPLLPQENFEWSHFYQFALKPESVIKDFEKYNFQLIKKIPYEGFKGLKDEVGFMKPLLQAIYNNKSLPSAIFCYVISKFLAPLSNHMTLLILRKQYSV